MRSFQIPKDEVFVIAEIANTHTGSVNKLYELIDRAMSTNADAIKFQLFKAEELLVKNHPEYDLYKKLEIPDEDWLKLFNILRKKNARIFADVFSIDRANFANDAGVDAFKIHSSDITNINLLEYVAGTGKPILLSCSGCTLNEIDTAVSVIKGTSDSQLILMHGFQGFPTKISQINLRRIASLKERYGLQVGYMDHIDGSSELALYLPFIALGLGANVIEKHITLNRDLKEEDYHSSLNPDEFAMMVRLLKDSQYSLGNASFVITEDELQYRKNMKKRLVASKDLKVNCKITTSDISLKRIHYNVPEIPEDVLIGGLTKTAIRREMPFKEENVELKKIKVVAVIACRIQSTRLFAKPLQLVDERTILDYLIMQLKQSKLIEEIVLAISEKPENEIFVEFARKNGLKFIRGDDEDVLERLILAADHVNANVVLRVTSEDPFKYWQAIDFAIKQHISTGADFTYTQDLPEGAGFELINLDALKRSHELGERRHRSELVTSYIFDHQDQFKIVPYQVKTELRRPELRLTVDYPEDLILIRIIRSKLPKEKQLPDLEDIIELLDKNPELKEINRQFVEHDKRIWL